MSALSPLLTLFQAPIGGVDAPLTPALRDLYGTLRFPVPHDLPYVMSNFVATLDGVVSLGIVGQAGGGEISGFNQHDRMVMGLLRAVSDAVIVGAGTLRAVPQHVWTPEHVYPALAGEFSALRVALGKGESPLNVIVTAKGEIDLGGRVFQSGKAPVLIVTTDEGARRLNNARLPDLVRIVSVGTAQGRLEPKAILDAVNGVRRAEMVLLEAGPSLTGDFLAARCVDELFLTLAPQIAGRDGRAERPGLVQGRVFAPTDALWGHLLGVKQAGDHLFLRYGLSRSSKG